MNKTITVSALILWVASVAGAQIIDKPAATVNLTRPEFISVKQLQQQIDQFDALRSQGLSGLPTDPLVVLDSMIQDILLKQAAGASDVRISDAEVDAYIAQVKKSIEAQQGGQITDRQFREIVFRQTGLGWEDYRESIREQRKTIVYVRKEKQALFDAMDQPSDEQIEAQFRRNATNFANPEIVRISEIFIDTRSLSSSEKQKARERAESILRAYRNGEGTFSELVLKYSDDTKSRYNDGDKGFFARNDPRIQVYGEDFFEKVFSLEVGEVSNVLASNVGYHIVKVTDHRDPKLLGIDDPIYPWEKTTVREFIRNAIVEQLEQQVFQRALKELVDELKEKAEIRIYEENIPG